MRDKTIVITGAFGALGSATSKLATTRGAQVAGLDLSTGSVADTVHMLAIAVDLTDVEATMQAMESVASKTGRIDALLNIAGGFVWEKFATGNLDTWDRMYALNLKTAVTASRAALPFLIESQGAIVNVGAAGAVKATAGLAAYAASKQGVMKLTESLADELKGKVRVNAVLPSIFDTPQNRADMPNSDYSKWVQAEELAKAILYLASDEASAITGALIPVTGQA
jgi:NAD(P)-dependent dehydrogenase (short-subunit alcohol dehydrogenase family)